MTIYKKFIKDFFHQIHFSLAICWFSLKERQKKKKTNQEVDLALWKYIFLSLFKKSKPSLLAGTHLLL